jgi:hypothetical protein
MNRIELFHYLPEVLYQSQSFYTRSIKEMQTFCILLVHLLVRMTKHVINLHHSVSHSCILGMNWKDTSNSISNPFNLRGYGKMEVLSKEDWFVLFRIAASSFPKPKPFNDSK